MNYYLNENLLDLLEKDPNQFYRVYQGWVASTIPPQQRERLEWGQRFHQIMRQRLMGLPVDSLLATYPKLKHWVNQLTQNAPEIFEPNPDNCRSWDEQIQVTIGDIVLSSTYDLIIRGYQSAQIIDWTTSSVPNDYLESHCQTQLKLYLLAETDTYLAEEISLTYWLLMDEVSPKCLKFTYSQEQHEIFKDQLEGILSKLREPILIKSSTSTDQGSLAQFLQGQISAKDYVASVPEVEI
ncbi:MAG TPA: PD-(D/E)XK nuclease family protein [Cyanobacteria bacterium UBA12227]|nr:PD-(D/E)XK nuclease family protein [Cyanobacteria bacterium UBA12227]HAX88333.1 PD-(D/E)XK nuclease family protein [Cyanobacteria bacterium UBA11370]HBY81143.1 PD-(D/E)XK nuclease family protein [Cyanobacteria bacterium UBA11148]